jgi:hypothetical protein
VPASYGAAQPTTAPAAGVPKDRELGLEDPHPLVVSMWNTIQSSCEATFYSEADWARLRLELWYANEVMRNPRPTGQAWTQVQHGLSDLLVSPAAKRRCAIELKAAGPDEDADAAVSMTANYQRKLQSVPSTEAQLHPS